ncbi:hypothetical protein CCH79_00016018 [Gambusia affinis]|uniref:Vav guanine nucleotide exchange factor 3 n=1 Tax=Gambusia affinis TaxID=33528 RepID=A0A315VPP5_GAMAF|nr:hypothetical protein CCH79_00016018 [Gambusia affinis]
MCTEKGEGLSTAALKYGPYISNHTILKNAMAGKLLDVNIVEDSCRKTCYTVSRVSKDMQVMDTLSKLSHTSIAQQMGVRHFPTEERVEDEDIYNHLEDLMECEPFCVIVADGESHFSTQRWQRGAVRPRSHPLRASHSENGVEDEEDLYACVYEDEEGGEIYEDLMKTEAIPPPAFQKQAEIDIRSCCLTEIKQTEEKYTETLESIEKHFMMPLTMFFSTVEMEKVFVNIPELVKVHKGLLLEIQESVHQRSSQNLYQIFISFKERLLIYGKYCSHVETAITTLDDICKNREDVRMKLEECSKRANYGKFTLRDLLVVPMQRVLKYHLLLQELVKHTHDASEKSNLRTALDAMKDLAQYVNEVKRDNETLREIEQYQRSIENLNQPLSNYGRPKGDGEVRVTSVDKRAKQDRHIFLFDAAVIVCKRRGDNYEMKEVIDLHLFKITNNPTSDKENRKWSYGFYLTHNQGQNGFEFFFKTKELKKKWLEQFGMAISNLRPENATNNFHEFRMHTFERITSCNSCHMLLRGVFYQGYLCSKCGLGAHKECLGRFGCCGKTAANRLHLAGLPKMLVIRNYFGVPSPASGPALTIQTGDIIELICADLHSPWWQELFQQHPTAAVHLRCRLIVLDLWRHNPARWQDPVDERGWLLSKRRRAAVSVPKPVDYSSQPWFAGPIERFQAEAELINRVNSTYLVRHRSKEFTEYAISIKYNNDVKHIKILTKEGCYYIAENKKFRSILELIEYYKHHSLREGFKSLDTTLQFPYREPENAAVHRFNRPGSNSEYNTQMIQCLYSLCASFLCSLLVRYRYSFTPFLSLSSPLLSTPPKAA